MQHVVLHKLWKSSLSCVCFSECGLGFRCRVTCVTGALPYFELFSVVLDRVPPTSLKNAAKQIVRGKGSHHERAGGRK